MLLDHLHGAPTRAFPGGTDMNAAMEKVAKESGVAGNKPYIIMGGGLILFTQEKAWQGDASFFHLQYECTVLAVGK